MSVVHAPYGFVPLYAAVFRPEWAHQVSQDWPFQDGISGTLDIEVTAETPIFVRGAKNEGEFFSGPDGKPAIPGSSLRGALRNVVEIASYGALKRVNDHRYGVRDLQNQDLYVRHMAGIMDSMNGKKLPLPRVIAGWLQKVNDPTSDEEVARIYPCHFAKIDYRLLTSLAEKRGVRNYRPGDRQSAPRKYEAWGVRSSNDDKLKFSASIEDLRPHLSEFQGFKFGRVTGEGPVQGSLVFTGQPSKWDPRDAPRRGGGHPKHHDFFFYGGGDAHVKVSKSVFEGFEFIHSDGAQQHSLNRSRNRNSEWTFWGKEYDCGHRIPVFFLLDRKGLRAFGLAMMFRLAYKNSVRESVDSTQKRDRRPDLAELLFGHVSMARDLEESKEESRKGRVSVGLLRLQGEPQKMPPQHVVLGAPKASYYPSYIEQTGPDSPGSNASGKDKYKTFMDDGAVIRGFKRYRVQQGVVRGPPPPTRGDGTVNENVATTFSPLKEGATFRGKLRFHNVRPVELGALLWALDFGGEQDCRHTLGMARSLGYGRCRISIVGDHLVRNDRVVPLPGEIRQQALAAFAQTMTRFCEENNIEGKWIASRRIYELVELARPLPQNSPHRNHMSIAAADPNGRGKLNQFQEAKKSGSALPPAGTDAGWQALATHHGITIRRAAPQPRAPLQSSPAHRTAAPQNQSYQAQNRPSQTAPLAQMQAGAWSPIKGGTEIRVKLTSLSKKGKWQAEVLPPHNQNTSAKGTIQGDAPADAASGQEHGVVVTSGGDRNNLGLKWK